MQVANETVHFPLEIFKTHARARVELCQACFDLEPGCRIRIELGFHSAGRSFFKRYTAALSHIGQTLFVSIG